MSFNVELRERIGGAFTNIIHVATHVSIVDGLLDGTGKFNVSLLPPSILQTKKMAGPMSGTKTLAQCLAEVAAYNNNQTTLYPGTYLIANGDVTLNPSVDHYLLYGDDGGGVTSLASTLENGDHLFYIKLGSENFWTSQNAVLSIPESHGVADLSAPYNTMSGAHIRATIAELEAELGGLVNDAYGLITGYRWVVSDLAGYTAKTYKVNKVVSEGSNSVADATKACIPTHNLWDYGQGSIALRTDTGVGYNYYVMVADEVDFANTTELEAGSKIYRYVLLNNKHFWGVINNTYPLATIDNAGLMSASDKSKLNGLISNATHTGDVTGSTTLTIGSNKVTFAKMQDIATATIIGRNAAETGDPKALTVSEVRTMLSISGVEDNANYIQFATEAEMEAGTDTTKAMHPLRVKQAVDFFGGMKRYGTYADDAAVANAAHPDGAIAMFAI